MYKICRILLALTLGLTACGDKAPAYEGNGKTLVVAYDYFSEKFSPFFATTSYDQDAAGLTQVSLLPSDREGNVLLNAKDGQVVAYNGTDYTYNNWGKPEAGDRIDYILIGKGSATVLEYHVVNNSHNGIYSSDHCPIYIKTKIN